MKILLFFLLFIFSCSPTPTKVETPCVTCTPENLVYASKKNSEEVLNTSSPSQKISLSQKGIQWAEKCIRLFPEEVGCYYYRAVNKGLYLETTLLGYKKLLKEMIADCEIVLQKDPSYDEGGAHRILGNIYLRLPEMAPVDGNKDPAEKEARLSLQYGPENYENLLLMGEFLHSIGKKQDSKIYFQKVKEKLSSLDHRSRFEQKNLEKVEKFLDK